MPRLGADDSLRAYQAIRADADELAREVRAYRRRRAEDQPPPALDLAFIRRFQRRLTGIHARWDSVAAAPR